MHSMNIEDGLKGSEKLPADENNTFTKFMNIERRSTTKRISDWWNGVQIRSYLAIKGFDQYHGVKLVNKALSEKD